MALREPHNFAIVNTCSRRKCRAVYRDLRKVGSTSFCFTERPRLACPILALPPRLTAKPCKSSTRRKQTEHGKGSGFGHFRARGSRPKCNGGGIELGGAAIVSRNHKRRAQSKELRIQAGVRLAEVAERVKHVKGRGCA